MGKLTRNLATGLVAGVLVAGTVVPALALGDEEVSERPSATDQDPPQTRVQAREVVRDPGMTAEQRAERLAAREVFREQRDAWHRERIAAAVEAGELTQEQADRMLEARADRPDRGAGQRGPAEGGRRGARMGPGEGRGPEMDCPNR